jgi:rare lipoprotein A
LTAAHKYLPLPTHVKVTNLENNRSVIVRVNDRGPFPSDYNPGSGSRIIDLSAAAASQLGFYSKGLARVKVETIELKEEG